MVSRRGFLRGLSSGVVATGAALSARPAFAGGRQVVAPTLTSGDLKPTGPLDEAYWWKVRSQFNILDGMTFMNNGTEGPVPRVVVTRPEREILPRDRREPVEQLPPRRSRRGPRHGLAKFVNANPDEIALTRSTTEGMNLFTHGLDWKTGDG